MNIKRGDVFYIESSNFTVGSEQRPGRPAVVVSNDKCNEHSAVVEVVYLTTQPKHDLPTHVTIRSLSRESTALCEQITSVATERFGDYCGHVTPQELQRIETAMQISLGLCVTEAPPPLRQRIIQSWRQQRQNARFFKRCMMRCWAS